ncbi:MAG: FAD-dependent oxidoreductase [Propionivibrio sp.]|uniref:hydroxysqualene dehydroxylase HpnE n=1 Tax=Propionivibrio sp. TaxID=2212460 RepID=UPI001A4BD015|nr:hydroxysqualene dehydroxylase HpnE [Propionivibrio sp.]MBL8416318.1 FAD-dependent oxidoreductase [Propionivibrio sp.]
MKARLNVAVIGGGWAGLAAAVELVTAGAEVTVFEAAKQLGGRARSVETHGHRLDNGQHLLIGAYRETLRLIQTVGANPEHLLRRLPLDLHYPGAGFRLRLPRLPAPLNLAIGLFAAQGAGLGEKFATVRFMRYLQGCNYRLATDGTVAELLDRHGQQGKLRRYLWEPLCLAALNTAPQHASAQIFANVLRDSLGARRADTDLLLPATDLDRVFPSAAADYVRAHGGKIRLTTRVEQIRPQLHIEGELFDRVILALAPQHAVSLLAGQPETAAIADMLAEYTYEPIGTAYAGYPPEVSLPCPMLGLDGGREGGLGQWVFDRGTLCATPGVMSFVLSAQGAWDQRNNEVLVAILHGELEEALARPLPQPLWHWVIRERRATFSCRPDLPRPTARTPLRDLWLAGDYTCADYPATLEGAVRSGITAARGALRSRLASQ